MKLHLIAHEENSSSFAKAQRAEILSIGRSKRNAPASGQKIGCNQEKRKHSGSMYGLHVSSEIRIDLYSSQ
jgi:hypothetical protein